MSNKYPKGKSYPKSQGNTETRTETTLKNLYKKQPKPVKTRWKALNLHNSSQQNLVA